MRQLRTVLLLLFTVVTFTVAGADFAFLTTPRYTTIAGGPISFIVPDTQCSGGACDNATATIGDITIPLTHLEGNVFTGVAPMHLAGAVDIVLRIGPRTETSPAALHYVDPAAPPDEATFERILVPLIYNGPGALGSEWATDAELLNRNRDTLTFFQPLACSTCDTSIATGKSLPLAGFGNRASGLLLFVPREQAADVAFGLKVRDVSRDDRTSGAEVPVVREAETHTNEIVLVNVPFHPRNRLTLRLYGIDGTTGQAMVQIVGSTGVSGTTVQLQPPVSSDAPSFATVDLSQHNFQIYRGTVDVIVDLSLIEGGRFWGFVTVTNNETQQVTVVTPQ